MKDASGIYRYASASADFQNGAIQDIATFEGKSAREVCPPERVVDIEALDAELLSLNRAVEVEITTPHPGGGLRRLEGSKFPIHIGSETLIGGFVIDETARYRADKEKERMSSALEHSGEMIVITDVDGTIEYVNPVFEQIMGYAGKR
ncbi:MAG: PAS domain-containing protein [Gammaproteobacteria bacterium]|nr:PAS domain-containing protein [Gammaproteobacteria bacterium]